MNAPAPLHVLVSEAALATYGESIAQAVRESSGAQRMAVFKTVEQLAGAAAPLPCEVAYLTRDITGASTKGMVLPGLQGFYDVLAASPGLRWIHGHSAGADRPIFGELRQRGVRVSMSSGANDKPVAHTALAAVLMLGRRMPELMLAQRAHRWSPLVGRADVRDLCGQTAMVVGLGPIGQEVGRLLHAVGLRVLGATRSPPPRSDVSATPDFSGLSVFEHICRYEDLPGLAGAPGQALDYLVLCCPLSALTRGLVGAELIARLPAGAFVVNVARGEVIDEPVLIAALRSGHLAGAFLDVFAAEPLAPESPLWDMPNVVVSPHTAGHFAEHAQRVQAMFLDNLGRYLAGQRLRNELD